jgi:hypothetical protein
MNININLFFEILLFLNYNNYVCKKLVNVVLFIRTMNTLIKHIVTSYIFILLVGTLFFVPSLFVSRFTTAPAVWMQVGIIVGTIGYVFAKKITLPPVGFILLITMWGLYHVLQNHGNIDKITTIITLMVSFYLFYAISPHLKLKQLFIVLAFLALVLSLWGLLQSINILPINIGSDTITGPFDNPAGRLEPDCLDTDCIVVPYCGWLLLSECNGLCGIG